MTLRTVLVATVTVAFFWGCGDDPPPATTGRPAAPQQLTGFERRAADGSVAVIRQYCRQVARYLTRGGRPPAQAAAVAGARAIAGMAAAKPTAPYRGTQTIRDLAGDLAEDLEGTNCSTRLVAELQRGLR